MFFFCLQILFFPQSGFSRLGDRAFTYCEEEEEEEWECVGDGHSGGDALIGLFVFVVVAALEGS